MGETYWLVTSSFEYAPGVPLFRSTDLVSWEQVGHVLARPSQLDVATARPSGGIFAPTLRHHDGRLWMVTTNMSDGGGHLRPPRPLAGGHRGGDLVHLRSEETRRGSALVSSRTCSRAHGWW